MIFYCDLSHCLISDPTTTGSVHFSTEAVGFLSPSSTQYVPALRAPSDEGFVVSLSLGEDGRTTGSQQPQDVTFHILHEVAGQNRVALLNPETYSYLGRSASIYGAGTGGDGTVYNQGSPLVVGSGKIISHRRVGKLYDEMVLRPHSDAFRLLIPSKTMIGYRDGLRFDGNSAQAEITGYTAVPAEFTLGAAVLFSRAWTVGASDTQTIAGTRSARLYFTKTTNEYGRQLKFDYEISGPSTVTVNGPTFDADESVKFITARVDTTPASGDISVEFGIDQSFSTTTGSGGALSATAEAWKLGRFRTSTTDSADTIIGAWFLFDVLLTDAETVRVTATRLLGNEDDLVWFFPGESAGGVLVDYGPNETDATITTATSAPLLLGDQNVAGARPPAWLGHVQNAPLLRIDASRLIYRCAENNMGWLVTVTDRQSEYAFEAFYDSVLDFCDNPPTVSGNVTVCPYMGGLVRVHTEVDGAVNSAYGLGISQYPFSMYTDNVSAGATWGLNDLDSIFQNPPWTVELVISVPPGSTTTNVFTSDYLTIRLEDVKNYQAGRRAINAFADLSGGGSIGVFSYFSGGEEFATIHMMFEAWESGGGAFCRMYINGSYVGFAGADVGTLEGGASTTAPLLKADPRVGVLPFSLWSLGGDSITTAETRMRTHMYSTPSPSEPGIAGLWYRYTTSVTTLDDETSAGNDATLSGDVAWYPGLAATDRLTLASKILSDAGISVAFADTAYDYDVSPISYPIVDTQLAVSDVLAGVLSGGGLYSLLLADGSVLIGQAQDPSTATPAATVRVEFIELDAAEYEFQPSHLEATYGPNPVPRTDALVGGTESLIAFAAKEFRVHHHEVGSNRSLYNDDPYPQGRKWILDTKFMALTAAKTEAARVSNSWDSPRPKRRFFLIGSDGDRVSGYTSYQPGDVLTIENERLPGGSVTVLVLDVNKSSTADVFTGR